VKSAAIVLVALIVVLAAVRAAWIAHANRFDRLATTALHKFQESDRSDLYAHHPLLIAKVADNASLAARVKKLHLSGCDFGNGGFEAQDFSAIARLPNLVEIECTYAQGVETIVPIINSTHSLETLNLYYCGPADAFITGCNSSSLRTLRIHSYSNLEIDASVLEGFTNRMPECKLHFSTD